MNEQELDLKLKAMQNELTALKTSHERGLGAFKFYTAQTTFRTVADSTYLVELTVTIADGEPIPPFVELGWDMPYYCQIQSSRLSSNNRVLTWKIYWSDYYIPTGTLLHFRVVSISRIQSFTAKLGEWDV